MAHSTLHFSLGLIVGTAVQLPRILRRWRRGRPVSRCFGNWLLVSYGLGLWAVVPGLLRRAGVPDSVCDGWWMNVFLFYPLLNKVRRGGMIPGEIAVASCFALQYLLLLAALRYRLRR